MVIFFSVISWILGIHMDAPSKFVLIILRLLIEPFNLIGYWVRAIHCAVTAKILQHIIDYMHVRDQVLRSSHFSNSATTVHYQAYYILFFPRSILKL